MCNCLSWSYSSSATTYASTRRRESNNTKSGRENMVKSIGIAKVTFLLVLFVSTGRAQSIFDVTKDGAKANGPDINAVLARLLLRFKFKALSGAGKTTEDGGWVTFQRIQGFTLSGGGIFDGQGASSWGACGNDYCKQLPINMRFDFITNGLVQDVTSLNSKQFHVNVLGCKNVAFRRFTITAPADSKNTDGIHIGRSSGIEISDSKIATGDDCISIGGGAQNVSITKVTCGPGHGISVGSLGQYEREEPVVGITVKGCTLTSTDNGMRIKTWPASYAGSASNMHFEDLTMVNVSNPIIIDQAYCPHNDCNAKHPSRVKINNVSFKNIRGTSATPVAVKLACSSGVPCDGVELANIDLKYIGKEGHISSECSNVKPKVIGVQSALACGSPTAAPSRKA
ncbi:hypothetical protein Pint_36050 [Pistacia integerrima]|uniref:Uncharacterized protein n=1 Tax=Pistacia integerrima TaxID=434235 RepID=A0ACC0Y270_9ROSI|nr:hypothetical protein Pint_36050 [Pistacia integerrima]